jgi:hypothetical protein
LAKQVGVKYKDSLRCLGGCIKKLKLEQQIPLVAQFVLTVAVPLLFFNFEEARIVLKWSLAQYVLTHALMHFSSQSPIHPPPASMSSPELPLNFGCCA